MTALRSLDVCLPAALPAQLTELAAHRALDHSRPARPAGRLDSNTPRAAAWTRAHESRPRLCAAQVISHTHRAGCVPPNTLAPRTERRVRLREVANRSRRPSNTLRPRCRTGPDRWLLLSRRDSPPAGSRMSDLSRSLRSRAFGELSTKEPGTFSQAPAARSSAAGSARTKRMAATDQSVGRPA
jgi:hypothetical protein